MSGTALVITKAPLTLTPNDANQHECIITSDIWVVTNLLRRYATEHVITKGCNEIRIFKRASLTT